MWRGESAEEWSGREGKTEKRRRYKKIEIKGERGCVYIRKEGLDGLGGGGRGGSM